MIARRFQNCLIRPGDLAPSHDDLEVIGIFNPGAVEVQSEVVLLLRVAERPREHRDGHVALPRWQPGQGLTIDWIPDENINPLEQRIIQLRDSGHIRLTFISHLRVVRSRDGRSIDSVDGPLFMPDRPEEEFGVEDPRITPLDGQFYFTYVAVSRHGAATALASTRDFQTFERHGIIFCTENKDVVLFPERIPTQPSTAHRPYIAEHRTTEAGTALATDTAVATDAAPANLQYVALHRPSGSAPFGAPEIWLARSADLLHWGRHEVLPGGDWPWSGGRVGAGAPPLRTEDGWLEIYHGNDRRFGETRIGAYAGGALLLDAEDPARIRRRAPEPILIPQAQFERRGFVPDVVFPTGVIRRDDCLQIFYGAADTAVGVVELTYKDVMTAMEAA